MLLKRTIVVILLLPVGVGIILLGGPVFVVVVAAILAVAAWEYAHLFQKAGYQPANILLVSGVIVITLFRGGLVFSLDDILAAALAIFVLLALVWHVLAYERGRDQAPVDFAVTMGGLVYLGWVASYLAAMRTLPGGQWWLLLVLPAVWIADTGAYLFGSRWGRRRISPRVSPRKTWEGYWAGVISGVLGGAFLGWLWQNQSVDVTPLRGAILGLVFSVVTIFGDLGESMFKRLAGVKDSSNLIPGHGGFFDRIDSWIWAGAIGYFLIAWLWV